MFDKIFDDHVANHLNALSAIKKDKQNIEIIASMIATSYKKGGKLVICGNGGSASDAMHIAGELIGRYKSNRPPLDVISLNSDVSVMTCIANDFGYENVFSRQLEGVAKQNDFLIGISTSGNSKNIYNLIMKANELGINHCFLGGKDGGTIKKIATNSIIVPSMLTASIQEMHIIIGHILCSFIEHQVYGISDNE